MITTETTYTCDVCERDVPRQALKAMVWSDGRTTLELRDIEDCGSNQHVCLNCRLEFHRMPPPELPDSEEG